MTGDGRAELVTGADPLRIWRRDTDDWWDHTVGFTEIGSVETGVSAPWRTALADLDNDGLTDIVTSHGGQIEVFLNKDDGQFEAGRLFDVGASAHALIAADLDGRGAPDLALVHDLDDQISVLRSVSRVGRDANNNGVPDDCDIAVGRSSDCNANGIPDEADLQSIVSFSSPRTIGDPGSPLGYDGTLAVLDIHTDDDIDLVAVNTLTREAPHYFINFGRGTLGIHTPEIEGWYEIDRARGTSAAGGNLSGGIKDELAIAHNAASPDEDHEVQVYRQGVSSTTGAFQWEVPTSTEMDDRIHSVTALDLDADDMQELIVITSDSIVLLNDSGDGLEAVAEISLTDLATSVTEAPSSVILADMDGDDRRDLVFSVINAHEVSICKQNVRLWDYGPCESFAAGSLPGMVRSADLDGDGLADLVLNNQYTDHISLLFNRSREPDVSVDDVFVLGAPTELELGRYWRIYPTGVVLNDFDSDGDVDIATANWYPDNVSVLRNDGGAAYSEPFIFPAGFRPEAIVLADVDNDGRGDLIVGNANRTVTVLINRSRAAVSTDTDGDGRPDECTR